MRQRTIKQEARDKKHLQLIKRFYKLDAKAGSRTELWATLAEEFGYNREWIQRILRNNGVDYRRPKNNNDHEERTQNAL